MRSQDYIQQRFRLWAGRQNSITSLQGSKGDRGERNYTLTLEENLFEPLSAEARRAYETGAGGELRGNPCNMQALHSSAAMTVNLFHYLCTRNMFAEAAKILRVPSGGIASMQFERQYPVVDNPEDHGLQEAPHLDIGLDYSRAYRVGVECKLFEPFNQRGHTCLREAYLDLPGVWDDMSAVRHLADELAEGQAGFSRLGPAQLVKHILGLKKGLTKEQFRLIYLYYDAPGNEAACHRDEIRRFADVISEDGIRFQVMGVQEFIIRASAVLGDQHRCYVDYLCERYL